MIEYLAKVQRSKNPTDNRERSISLGMVCPIDTGAAGFRLNTSTEDYAWERGLYYLGRCDVIDHKPLER